MLIDRMILFVITFFICAAKLITIFTMTKKIQIFFTKNVFRRSFYCRRLLSGAALLSRILYQPSGLLSFYRIAFIGRQAFYSFIA